MNNYFSHDSNARNSTELLQVRIKFGAEGYGIYFMLLERLRDEEGYMSIKDYNTIAFDLHVDSSIVKSIIEDFGLFVFTDDGKYFYSEGFSKRMEKKDEVSKKRSESGKKGNEVRYNLQKNNELPQNTRKCDTNTSQMREVCEGKTSQNLASKVKESKVKESKYNPPLTPPFDEEAQNISSKNMDALMEYCVKYQATEGQKDELIRTTNGGESSSRVWELIKWMDEHPGHTMSDLMPTLCEMEKKGLLKCESETLYYTKKKLQKMVTPADYLQIMQYSSSDIFEDTLSKLITEVENSKGRITMPAKYIIKNLKSCV